MNEDGEFEVTAEMLIHEDVDDEQTLAEEEALESAGEAEEEMADLQQESEIPLEELLKRYGYAFHGGLSVDAAPTACGDGEQEDRDADEDSAVGGVKRVRVRDGELVEGANEDDMSLSDVKRVKFLNQEVLDDKDDELGAKRGESGSLHPIKFTNTDILNAEEKAENSLGHLEAVSSIHSSHSVSSGRMRAGDHNVSNSTQEHSKSNHITSPSQAAESHQSSRVKHSSDNSLVLSSSSLPYSRTRHDEPSPHTTLDSSGVAETSSDENELFLTSTDGLVLGQPLLPDEVDVVSGHAYDSRFGCVVEEVGGEAEEDDDDDEVESEEEEEEEDSRESFGGDGSGCGSLLMAEEQEKVENSTKNREDQLSSSDVHVHTPSTSSLSLQASSSTSSGSSRTHADIKSRLRPEVPERRSMRLMANDEKVLEYFSAFFDDEEGDEEYVPVEEWKQDIRVGSSYQVAVEDRPSLQPYPNATEAPDRLQWRPHTPDERVVSYLKTVATVLKPDSGNSSWETEQALQLLQDCGHDVQRAIDVVQEKGLTAGPRPWTEKECNDFEQGLRVSGKDFFQLKKQVPSRSVKELVEFYYIWKKSKRYDDFIQHGKIGKKKIPFQPGQVCDFMDNYLNMQDSGASDVHYSTTTVYAEHKKDSV